MRAHHNLWVLSLVLPAAQAAFFADALEGDALALSVFAPPRRAEAVIEAIYGEEPDRAAVIAKLSVLAEVAGIETPSFTVKASPNLDWLKKVAEDFPPLRIARWTVHGAMHRDKAPNRLNALQIDATSAFGTGEHPTTRGCLLMLDGMLKNGFRPRIMADIGCGSGILAMAAIKAARCRAVAVDLDPDSVQIAQRNMRDNGLGAYARIGRSRGYAAPAVRAGAPYDLIMANIFAGPLCRMARDLKNHLRPGGIAILSGLLTSQAKKVVAAHRMQGMRLIRHAKDGEWSVLALRR